MDIKINGVTQVLRSDSDVSLNFSFNWSRQSDIIRYLGANGSMSIAGVVTDAQALPTTGQSYSNTINYFSNVFSATVTGWLVDVSFESIYLNGSIQRHTANFQYVISAIA